MAPGSVARRARPDELFDRRYWADLVSTAERGPLDFVTIEDAFTLQSANRFDAVDRDRPGARSARRAARRSRGGTADAPRRARPDRHDDPHRTVPRVQDRIATLDHVSHGRAGWRVQVGRHTRRDRPRRSSTVPRSDGTSPSTPEGRAAVRDRFDEAADHVEVVRRLWDSWEDDAEIRDVTTGRFVDRDRLHHVDFEGRHFSVRGPSITPRPPQGSPSSPPWRTRRLRTSWPPVGGRRLRDAARRRAGREHPRRGPRSRGAGRARHHPLTVFADLVVVLGARQRSPDPATPARRGRGSPFRSDAHVFTGTAADLASLLLRWHDAGYDGFRLRPARRRRRPRRRRGRARARAPARWGLPDGIRPRHAAQSASACPSP